MTDGVIHPTAHAVAGRADVAPTATATAPTVAEVADGFRRAAAELRARGYGVVWLRRGEKNPKLTGWTLASMAPEDYRTGSNLGLMAGAVCGDDATGFLVCVDLDAPLALRLADEYLPSTDMIDGRPGKARSHRWYRVVNVPPHLTSVCETAQVLGGGPKIVHYPGIDVLGTGGQAVVPPSMHASGERREWEGGAPGTPAVVDCATLYAAVERLAVACGHVPGGGDPLPLRSEPLTKLATGGCADVPVRCGSPDDIDFREWRAIRLLEKAEPAISKSRGHNKTLGRARAIAWGLDLGAEACYRLMSIYYNPKCLPPWSDAELRRKCEQADTTPDPHGRPRGYLLDEGRTGGTRHERAPGGQPAVNGSSSPVVPPAGAPSIDPDDLHRVYAAFLHHLLLSPRHVNELDGWGVPRDPAAPYVTRAYPLPYRTLGRQRREKAVEAVLAAGYAHLLGRVPGFALVRDDDGAERWTVQGRGLLIPVLDDAGRIVALLLAQDPGHAGQRFVLLGHRSKAGATWPAHVRIAVAKLVHKGGTDAARERELITGRPVAKAMADALATPAAAAPAEPPPAAPAAPPKPPAHAAYELFHGPLTDDEFAELLRAEQLAEGRRVETHRDAASLHGVDVGDARTTTVANLVPAGAEPPRPAFEVPGPQLDRCPTPFKSILVKGNQVGVTGLPCGALACPYCGPRTRQQYAATAECHLTAAAKAGVTHVWVFDCPGGEKLKDVMASRRFKKGQPHARDYLAFPLADGQVRVVSVTPPAERKKRRSKKPSRCLINNRLIKSVVESAKLVPVADAIDAMKKTAAYLVVLRRHGYSSSRAWKLLRNWEDDEEHQPDRVRVSRRQPPKGPDGEPLGGSAEWRFTVLVKTGTYQLRVDGRPTEPIPYDADPCEALSRATGGRATFELVRAADAAAGKRPLRTHTIRCTQSSDPNVTHTIGVYRPDRWQFVAPLTIGNRDVARVERAHGVRATDWLIPGRFRDAYGQRYLLPPSKLDAFVSDLRDGTTIGAELARYGDFKIVFAKPKPEHDIPRSAGTGSGNYPEGEGSLPDNFRGDAWEGCDGLAQPPPSGTAAGFG